MEICRSSFLNERFITDEEIDMQIGQHKDNSNINSIELVTIDSKKCDDCNKFNPKIQTAFSFENGTSGTNLDKQLFTKSSYSLNELDQIKKTQTTPDKSHKANFSTLNQKLRSKLSKAIYEFNSNKLPYLERLIRKNGEANIVRTNIKRRHIKYIWDLFNTIVDMKWRYLLLIFSVCFIASWTIFAAFWFFIARDCIGNTSTSSFIDFLLFSIETQQTIGYGYRYIDTQRSCGQSVLILMLQCGFSVIFESLMGGIVFAKLSRPKKRTETLIFSKKACIAYRDGKLCLLVRVGDLRKSHIIHAYIRMFLIRTRITKEGEIIPWNTQELNLSNNPQTSDRLIFMPIIVEHVIDEQSPLKTLIFSNSEKNLSNNSRRFKFDDFEIVVILEGTVESTGQTTQARTSFLPSEILWNHVFEPLMDSSIKSNKATIDFSKFNLTKKLSRTKKSIRRSLLPKIFLHSPRSYSKMSDNSSLSSTVSINKIA